VSGEHILVTGGAGYIGSHVSWRLHEAGFIPVVLDSLVSGHDWAVKFGPFAKGDIGDAAFVAEVCRQYKPRAFMHFAAFIEVGESVKNPRKFWDNNFENAKKFFTAAKAAGLRHGVFSSTAAVYGMPAQSGPITEDFALSPVNPYGETKKAAEQYLRELGVEGMTSVALRYFNAAGAAPVDVGIGEAHWPESHLIPRILLAALGHEPGITVFGTDYPTPDGTALRDYVHVTDLARAHISALRYLLEGGRSEVCNLGTGKGYSVRQVIDTAAACLGREIPTTLGPRREGDPPQLVASHDKAKKLLGWQPEVSLKDIIASAAAWHQSRQYEEAVVKVRYKK
jgi:UDP-glucose-4-epimerase GalE